MSEKVSTSTKTKKKKQTAAQRRAKARVADSQPSKSGIGTIRQARGDPKLGKKQSDLVISTAQNAITIQVPTSNDNIVYFAMGYVTKALEKGFQAAQQNVYDSFYAFIYLVQVLQQFAAGGQPSVQQLPYVVLAFGRAISQKTVGLDLGKATYSFQVKNQSNPNSSIPVGYSLYGHSWNILYVPSTPTFVNGFPVVTNAGYAVPTQQQLEAAFALMNQFLATRNPGKNKDTKSPFRMVALNEKTVLDNDVSTFANFQKVVGGGSGGPENGGFVAIAGLEVPIFRPMLACFNVGLAGNSGENQNRWGNVNVNTAGDPTFLGATLGHVFGKRWWGVQRQMKFHAVDFLEFGEVLSLWMKGILDAAMADPTGQWALPATSYACPLTMQEVLILLRNVFMCAFKDTQAAVQGLYPYNPVGQSDNQFVPFIASASTCFLEANDMKLPRPFIENIRALVFRHTSRKPPSGDLEFFIPVLGQYEQDVLVSADYTFTPPVSTPNPSPVPINVFAQGALFEKKTKGKEGVTWMKLVEVPINLIDGLSSSGHVAINNPQQLKNLTMQWNDWLATTNLSSYSVKLSTFGTENGSNICYSGNMTRHWAAPNNGKGGPTSTEVIKPETLYRDSRLQSMKWKAVVASPYADRMMVADTAQSPPYQVVYEQIQSTWVLPIIENELESTLQSSLVPRWQSLMKETTLLNSSSGFDGVSLSNMHSSYATKMVKSRQETPNDWEAFFSTLDEKGEGGILSGLVGGALGALFPAAKDTIKTIADIVPF